MNIPYNFSIRNIGLILAIVFFLFLIIGEVTNSYELGCYYEESQSGPTDLKVKPAPYAFRLKNPVQIVIIFLPDCRAMG